MSMSIRSLSFVLLAVFTVSCASTSRAFDAADADWVDLSHDFSEETLYWPTAEPFKLVTEFRGVNAKGSSTPRAAIPRPSTAGRTSTPPFTSRRTDRRPMRFRSTG
jgi:hypothetical protein